MELMKILSLKNFRPVGGKSENIDLFTFQHSGSVDLTAIENDKQESETVKSRNCPFNKLGLLNTIAFVVFCYFVGGAAAISLTCLIFDLNTSQLSDILKYPQISSKPVIIAQALIFTVSGFLVFPTIYLLITRGNSISVLRYTKRLQFRLLIVTIALVFSTLPLVSILIELNYNVPFPDWLSNLEIYFKEMEDAARKFNGPLLMFSSFKDLAIAILIMAIIPGFAEEYFFRGLVQTELQNVLKNHHYAILLSAFLFSLMHFQFYGLVPRMAFGVLLGYMFAWSNNIWYPIIAHIVNNSIVILSAYFWGPTVLDPESRNPFPITLLLVSIIVSVVTISYLKRNYRVAGGTRRLPAEKTSPPTSSHLR